jgi:hypothetical protein
VACMCMCMGNKQHAREDLALEGHTATLYGDTVFFRRGSGSFFLLRPCSALS